MKTRLYHKFVKAFCSDFKVSREQLFSRQLQECVMIPYVFNFSTHKLEKDYSRLMVLNQKKPLSIVWECYDFHARWLLKYWKHCHWKPYIQMHLDLSGRTAEDIIEKDILKHES